MNCLILKIIRQCEVKHNKILLVETITLVLKVLTYIIISIAAHPTRLAVIAVKEIRKLKSQDSRTSECLRFTGPNRISLVRHKKLKTAAPYWIIMKSKTPEKFEKLFPNNY